MKSYESSPGILRVFCPNCGCSLAFREDAAPEKDVVLLGVLDDPSEIEVNENVNHLFAKYELGWLHMDDGFPRAEELLKRSAANDNEGVQLEFDFGEIDHG